MLSPTAKVFKPLSDLFLEQRETVEKLYLEPHAILLSEIKQLKERIEILEKTKKRKHSDKLASRKKQKS